MVHRVRAAALAAWLASVLLCCAEDSKQQAEEQDYCPLAAGNYWVYEETGYNASVPSEARQIRQEVVDSIDMDFEHDTEGALPVFVVEKTFPPPGEPGSEDSVLLYYQDDGVRVVRKREELYDLDTAEMIQTVDYEPGRLRFDRSRTTVDENWDETYTTYTVSIPPEADDGVWDMTYLYRILEPETVTVPAGTFDCLVLSKLLTSSSGFFDWEEKIYYFAPGVGKVKEVSSPEEGTVKTEELVEYFIANSGGGA